MITWSQVRQRECRLYIRGYAIEMNAFVRRWNLVAPSFSQHELQRTRDHRHALGDGIRQHPSRRLPQPFLLPPSVSAFLKALLPVEGSGEGDSRGRSTSSGRSTMCSVLSSRLRPSTFPERVVTETPNTLSNSQCGCGSHSPSRPQ